MEESNRRFATVDDIQIIQRSGPWTTKSEGELNVLFSIPLDALHDSYFQYDQAELSRLSRDIRGLRSYRVSGARKGKLGANEWHRLRNELIFTTQGVTTWTFEDLRGKHRTLTLDGKIGVWVPPFILHAYETQTDKSEILVIANTLFFPEDKDSHDTYSSESFRQLQKRQSLA